MLWRSFKDLLGALAICLAAQRDKWNSSCPGGFSNFEAFALELRLHSNFLLWTSSLIFCMKALGYRVINVVQTYKMLEQKLDTARKLGG